MTPEEVFAKLRDIHVPPDAAVAGAALDLRPVIGFCLIVVGVLAVRVLRRQGRVRRALSRVDAAAAPSVQRDALVRLLAASDTRKPVEPPPAVLFDPPEAVERGAVATLRRWAARRLG